MTWKFEALGKPFDDVLDGPAWDGSGVLVCSVRRNEIHRWDPADREFTLVRHATVRTRGLAFAPDGRLYGAQSRARRVVWFSADGGTYYLNAMLDGERHNDPQDLVVDRDGRIWFADRYTDDSIPGPVGFPPLSHFSVLRLTEQDRPNDRDTGTWKLERMTFDTVAPGGIALSPDNRTLYVVDNAGSSSDSSTLKSYRIARSGPLGPPRVVHEFPDGVRAAGACTDSHGNVVVAVTRGHDRGGGMVVVLDKQGVVAETTPFEDTPTNCCFGGRDGTLFVTTQEGQLYASTKPPRRYAS